MMHHASDHAHRRLERRKPTRSQVLRDLAADWHRWTPAERLTAGAIVVAIWLAASSLYLAPLFHG
jgi:hypothetical protein